MNNDVASAPLHFSHPPIGSSSGAIDVITKVPGGFVGRHLALPLLVAETFQLIDVKIGRRSQLANSTALPGEMFQIGEPLVEFALDNAVRDEEIAIVVENLRDEAIEFHGTLLGDPFDAEAPVWPRRGMREFPLGYWSDVAPNEKRTLVVSRPQIVFEPRRLFVPRSILKHFAVHAISMSPYVRGLRGPGEIDERYRHLYPDRTDRWTIDLRTQAAMSHSANGHAWWTWPSDVNDRPSVADVADDVAIVVENLTDNPQLFRAAIVGRAGRVSQSSSDHGDYVSRVHRLVRKLGVTYHEAVQILDGRLNLAQMVLDDQVHLTKTRID